MRKVYLDVKLQVVLEMDEGIEVSDIMDESGISIDIPESLQDSVDVSDVTVEDYNITDSK